jgi:hypothetical protein
MCGMVTRSEKYNTCFYRQMNRQPDSSKPYHDLVA